MDTLHFIPFYTPTWEELLQTYGKPEAVGVVLGGTVDVGRAVVAGAWVVVTLLPFVAGVEEVPRGNENWSLKQAWS